MNKKTHRIWKIIGLALVALGIYKIFRFLATRGENKGL